MPQLTGTAVDPWRTPPKPASVLEGDGDTCIPEANGLLAGDDLPVFSGHSPRMQRATPYTRYASCPPSRARRPKALNPTPRGCATAYRGDAERDIRIEPARAGHIGKPLVGHLPNYAAVQVHDEQPIIPVTS